MEEKCLCANHSSSSGDNNEIIQDYKGFSAVIIDCKSQMSSSSSSTSSLLSSTSKEDVSNADIETKDLNSIESSSSSSTSAIILHKNETNGSDTGSNIDLVGLIDKSQKTIEIISNTDNEKDVDTNTEIDSVNINDSIEKTASTTDLFINKNETIFLETPVIEENQSSTQIRSNHFSHDDPTENVTSLPKRLNDDFELINENEIKNGDCDSVNEVVKNEIKNDNFANCSLPFEQYALSKVFDIREDQKFSTNDTSMLIDDDDDDDEDEEDKEKMSRRLQKMHLDICDPNRICDIEDGMIPDTSDYEARIEAEEILTMDLIERRDFEDEKRLTGGVIIRNCTNMLYEKFFGNASAEQEEQEEEQQQQNQEQEEEQQQNGEKNDYIRNLKEVLELEGNCAYRDHLSPPTSSRASLNSSKTTKSTATAKINLSSPLSHLHRHFQNQNQNQNGNDKSIMATSNLHHKEVQLKNNSASSTAADELAVLKDSSEGQNEQQEQQQLLNTIGGGDTNADRIVVKAATSAAAEILFSNPNSNDSLNSERSYITTTSSKYASSQKEPQTTSTAAATTVADSCSRTNVLKSSSSSSSLSNEHEIKNNATKYLIDRSQQSDDMASTSSARCLYASMKYIRNAYEKVSIGSGDDARLLGNTKLIGAASITKSNETKSVAVAASSSSSLSMGVRCRSSKDGQHHFYLNSSTSTDNNNQMQQESSSLADHLNDNEFEDEAWPECEGNSDEEICTCHHSSSCSDSSSSTVDNSAFGSRCTMPEEDLSPSTMTIYQRQQQQQQQATNSKDTELSSYIQMVSISEDDAAANVVNALENQENPSTDLLNGSQQRKRKYNESLLSSEADNNNSSVNGGDVAQTSSGRKRIAYDFCSTPRSNGNSSLIVANISNNNNSPLMVGRRTPRSIIPTRDNPPPELQDWLVQFQRWSHAERLLALNRLIEHCEPTQVRHMMKVIEPQFQRDFISLLPRELALQVLTYLEPKDLLRAAQTCRSWRFLCDDNLLWKEKCRKAQILTEPRSDRPKRGRAGNMPPITSPWKAAYMRQHIIEMNWRSRPIRDPKVLKGHDDHVITCLQFSGNRIVSGSDDNTLKVWSAVTGRCLRTLVGHTGGVWSSQMSGNIIISGSTDRTLKVWDMETGQCVHTLLGHTSTVRCMHLHGKKVVSGSRDATLRVWDIEQGSCLHVLVGHLAAVRCVQYDGKLIVSGAYDYMVKIWHPERQECLHTLQGHTNRVYSLQFDGVHVVSGSLDTSIRVWDVETGNCKHTLMGHQSLTSGMELRQNILVSGNADSTVKVWDITSGQCLQTLSGPNKHQSAVTCLQFNSRFVVTSSDDGTVKLWDVKTGEFIRNLVALDSGGSGGVVWRIRANDTKLICAVGSRNGTEETKLMVLDFDVEGACVKCS